MKTASYSNKINFHTDEELQLEPITLTQTRLDDAYKQLNAHVPGAENLIKITKQLKRQGLRTSEKSNLNKILNDDTDNEIKVYLRTQSGEGIKLKGLLLLVALAHLFNLRVYYFSTRKHARIINPSGKKIVALLHHVDSYLCTSGQWFSLEDTPDHKVPKQRQIKQKPLTPSAKSAATLKTEGDEEESSSMIRTGVSKKEIIATFKTGIQKYLRQQIDSALANADNAEDALKALDQLQRNHAKRKSLPRVYDTMQNDIISRHPDLQSSSPSWFADRMKHYKTFDRFGYFKEEGDALIEETRSFIQVCSWEQVLGHCDDPCNNNDDNDDDDENDGKEDQASKSYETETFSLRSLLRTEIKYDDFLQDIKDEQQRVGRCISELSKAGAILTDTIATGRAARLCGINNQQQNLDLRKLAPDFQFPPDAATVITIAPIPEDQDKLDKERICKREHFSNLLSGCVGSSIRVKQESLVYCEIRKEINDTGLVSKQDDFAFKGAMNDALTEYSTAHDKLWTRKRHNRDLRVLVTALLRLNLAPKRVHKYVEARKKHQQDKAKDKEEKGKEEDVLLDKRKLIKTLNHHMNQLAWAMCRGRPEGATNKLFYKVQEWQGKLDKLKPKPAASDKAPPACTAPIDPNTTPKTTSAKPKRQARLVERQLIKYDPLNVTDDDAEEKEEQGDDEQEGSQAVTEREPPNRRIRALTSIIKRILDTTKKQASAKVIKETAFKGTNLTDKECSVGAKIVNALRPYYCPESQNDEDPNRMTVHQAAPLAYITNAFVDIIVPQQHVLAVAPEVDPNDHAIHLSASALYTLVSGKYEVPCRETGKTVTSKRQAGIGEARRDVFGAFFCLPKIHKALKTRDLVFAYRLTFVNRHTVRILGVSGHEGDDRDASHDNKKACQAGRSSDIDMDQVEGSDNESEDDSVLRAMAVGDKAAGKGKQPMARTNPKGKGRAGKGKSRKAHNKSRQKKRKAKSSPSDRPSKKRNKNKDSPETKKKQDTVADDMQEDLKAQHIKELETCARRLATEVAKLHKQGTALENERADLANTFRREWKRTKVRNGEKYGELQVVRKQANCVIAQVAQKQRKLADIRSQLYLLQQKQTMAEPAALAKEQELLQEKIAESLAAKKDIGIIGVDPGLVVSATSVTTTAKDLCQTIVPYTRFQPSPSPSSSSAAEATQTQVPNLPTVARPLPPIQTYTANKKKAATLDSAHQARRERYKTKHGDNNGDQDRRQKEARTREIRHDVYHRKLASSWRVRGSRSTLTFFGAYKSTNSRIKGHYRGANASLQHHLGSPKHDQVTVTNEHRSSKTCPLCHSPTKLHQYRRDGKLVKVNGALRCTNPACPNKSRNTHNRDQVGSVNIASIGFSKAISASNTPIPPFSRTPSLSYTISPTWSYC